MFGLCSYGATEPISGWRRYKHFAALQPENLRRMDDT